jgi:hypothetical protein
MGVRAFVLAITAFFSFHELYQLNSPFECFLCDFVDIIASFDRYNDYAEISRKVFSAIFECGMDEILIQGSNNKWLGNGVINYA